MIWLLQLLYKSFDFLVMEEDVRESPFLLLPSFPSKNRFFTLCHTSHSHLVFLGGGRRVVDELSGLDGGPLVSVLYIMSVCFFPSEM